MSFEYRKFVFGGKKKFVFFFSFLIFSGISVYLILNWMQFEQIKTKKKDVSAESGLGVEDCVTEFVPIVRSGAWTDIGLRSSMEDVYLCVDNFMKDYGLKNLSDGPSAFYGVFPLLLLLFCSVQVLFWLIIYLISESC